MSSEDTLGLRLAQFSEHVAQKHIERVLIAQTQRTDGTARGAYFAAIALPTAHGVYKAKHVKHALEILFTLVDRCTFSLAQHPDIKHLGVPQRMGRKRQRSADKEKTSAVIEMLPKQYSEMRRTRRTKAVSVSHSSFRKRHMWYMKDIVNHVLVHRVVSAILPDVSGNCDGIDEN
ncbi:hypothetical protein PsorP6_001576 [Peronosclerospora sorghi]|uniref:Uncharacterized protein n=1 Tax=Peronosclerospora sorghi TaxID=230839 RepID=A0ACC0WVH4_9STRA|nr:hypothetical protein PsorP6_001576 [Peronosclerospora sorghi]